MFTLDAVAAFKIEEPPETYIYHVEPVIDCVAAISSDNCLRLVDPLRLDAVATHVIQDLQTEFTSLKALNTYSSVVLTAGRDGKVSIFDFRAKDNVAEFRPTQNVPLLSLATCEAGNAVAAGTELTNSQATVAIWDIRSLQAPKLEYVESHSDDVTELQYHPNHTSILLSGSTDGLVNIFDTTISQEEDAIHQTINHGASIHHAGFLGETDIFALSHDEKFSMYEMVIDPEETVEEPAPVHFGDLRQRLGCEYVTNVLSRPGGAVVGMGNHSQEKFDLIQLKRDPLWTFEQDTSVTLSGAHGSDIVRSFCFIDQLRMVLTAGEDGQIKNFQST